MTAAEDHVAVLRPVAGGWWTWSCRGEGCAARGGRYPSRWDALAAGVCHERGLAASWEPIGRGGAGPGST